MGLYTLLEQCAVIEETVGEVYRVLADSVPCDGMLLRIWRQMAQDEDAHAAQLRLARRLAKDAKLEQCHLSAAELEQLGRRAQTVLAGVKARALTADDALRVSLKLEQDFLKVHAAENLSLGDPSIAALFASLARADDEHVRGLREYRNKQSPHPLGPEG